MTITTCSFDEGVTIFKSEVVLASHSDLYGSKVGDVIPNNRDIHQKIKYLLFTRTSIGDYMISNTGFSRSVFLITRI